MLEKVQALRVAILTVKVRAMEPIFLPFYSGSTFRGAFGNSFKRVACSMPRQTRCSQCLLMYVCPYIYVFETTVPRELAFKGRQLPRPFVLRPPRAGTKEVQEGEILEFEFRLIGRAIELAPYFVAAMHRCGGFGLGKGRGKFELHEVWDGVSGNLLYKEGQGAVSNEVEWWTPADLWRPADSRAKRVGLNFVTPTRLTTNGKYRKRYDAELIARSAMRRCGDLLRAHCSVEPDFDVDEVLNAASKVQVSRNDMQPMHWKRYSARQDRKIDMTGMVGRLELEGEIGPIMPLLRAAELVHLGKGTAFGMGRVEVGTWN